jgi:hypothetical protein
MNGVKKARRKFLAEICQHWRCGLEGSWNSPEPVAGGGEGHALRTVARWVKLAANCPMVDQRQYHVQWRLTNQIMGPQVVAKPKMKNEAMTIIAVAADSVD